MTMSISCAPARTASSVSATLIEVKLCPEGKAVATEAIRTLLPRRCSTQSAIRSGYTQTAATGGMVGSPGLGRTALAHIAATLPGVSAPSSVVRSMQRTARSRAQSLEGFLIERLASEAALSSAPTSSTLRTPRISEPRWVRERAVAMRRLCDGGTFEPPGASYRGVVRTGRMGGAGPVEAGGGGDESAFDSLVGPLIDPAYKLAVVFLRDPNEAQDAVQEATVRAWRSLGRLRDEAAVRQWFFAIVANQCRSMRRARWWSVVRLESISRRQEDLDESHDQRLDLGRELSKL